MLKALPRVQASGPAVPLEQFVGQSAAEAGLSLERAQAQGDDRIDIAIGSVRPIALFSWLAALEGQGVRVDNMSARPSPTAGSVSVQAGVVRGWSEERRGGTEVGSMGESRGETEHYKKK